MERESWWDRNKIIVMFALYSGLLWWVGMSVGIMTAERDCAVAALHSKAAP